MPSQRHAALRNAQLEMHPPHGRQPIAVIATESLKLLRRIRSCRRRSRSMSAEIELLGVAESLRFGQAVGIFVNHRVAVPREVSGGFAEAGGGVQIRRHAFAGLTGAKLPAISGLANGDVAGREVRQHRRPRQRPQVEGGIGAQTSSQIST